MSKPYTAMSKITLFLTSKTLKKSKWFDYIPLSISVTDSFTSTHSSGENWLMHPCLGSPSSSATALICVQWQDHCSACRCISAGAPLQSISAQLYPAAPSIWTTASSTSSSLQFRCHTRLAHSPSHLRNQTRTSLLRLDRKGNSPQSEPWCLILLHPKYFQRCTNLVT